MKEVLIEAQSIPADKRHDKIFDAFDDLTVGESLLLVNNHDPLPLIIELNRNRPSQFNSAYLETGPTQWQVRLTKKMKDGCCGCC